MALARRIWRLLSSQKTGVRAPRRTDDDDVARFDEHILYEAFEAIDTDGDGAITLEELRRAISTTLGEASPKQNERLAQGMLAVADANKDGSISFDEYKQILLVDYATA